ncbi:MAG: B12-binding domain-containing radical SAM protein, partial [Candidatus Woesearchaeota archaeon]|nr:B12-binding domain-containing radical SAM protein [Candidatus Woesearchaeota archaeon]
MKILMLNPSYVRDFCKSARWATRSRGRVQRHPEYMLTATAVLEREHNVKFVDGAALNIPKKEIAKIISRFRPDLTVIHTTTPSIYNDISYAKLAKDFCSATVLVGAHSSAVPKDTFRIANKLSKGCVDMIVRGEEDYTLRDVAAGKEKKDILGLSYYEKGKVFHNPLRIASEDINGLPFPAWHHVKPEWYFNGGNLYPFITLISARGCFGRCTFCRETQVTFGRMLRLRHPKLVVAEIEYDLKTF